MRIEVAIVYKNITYNKNKVLCSVHFIHNKVLLILVFLQQLNFNFPIKLILIFDKR